ncbi:MAG: hypothetical protein H3C60_07540 [Sphingomonadaceae bacterium]|nr:hypothetical protein [Sphingomonadaceae bacterium]
MRPILALLLLSIPTPASADWTLPLSPKISKTPEHSIFGASGPRVLPPDHPLFHTVSVEAVKTMPEKIGHFLVPIVKRQEFEDALRKGLESAAMLASEGTPARFTLKVSWNELHAPLTISFSSSAQSRISYELVRNDTGESLFLREIVTESKSRGGDGAARLSRNARFAIMVNIASMIACLDKAAYGQAPENCTLTPLVRF